MIRLALSALLAAATWAAPAAAQSQRLPGERPGVEQRGLDCSPRRLRERDTLRIRLPAGHGGDFAVASPRGELFFIAFKQPDLGSSLQPLISEEAFRDMTELEVALAEFQGIPWRKPGDKRRIFQEAGTYTLLVSDALETERPAIDGWCKVRFSTRPERR